MPVLDSAGHELLAAPGSIVDEHLGKLFQVGILLEPLKIGEARPAIATSQIENKCGDMALLKIGERAVQGGQEQWICSGPEMEVADCTGLYPVDMLRISRGDEKESLHALHRRHDVHCAPAFAILRHDEHCAGTRTEAERSIRLAIDADQLVSRQHSGVSGWRALQNVACEPAAILTPRPICPHTPPDSRR